MLASSYAVAAVTPAQPQCLVHPRASHSHSIRVGCALGRLAKYNGRASVPGILDVPSRVMLESWQFTPKVRILSKRADTAQTLPWFAWKVGPRSARTSSQRSDHPRVFISCSFQFISPSQIIASQPTCAQC